MFKASLVEHINSIYNEIFTFITNSFHKIIFKHSKCTHKSKNLNHIINLIFFKNTDFGISI